jgi:hypothetical protein
MTFCFPVFPLEDQSSSAGAADLKNTLDIGAVGELEVSQFSDRNVLLGSTNLSRRRICGHVSWMLAR